jgi:hypothetical protein
MEKPKNQNNKLTKIQGDSRAEPMGQSSGKFTESGSNQQLAFSMDDVLDEE